MNAFARVYSVVTKIPRGKVLTYADVACIARIKTSRFVGLALHRNPDPKRIPCHRVVRRDGTIAKGYAFGGAKRQRELLEKEGVLFLPSGAVELAKSLLSINL